MSEQRVVEDPVLRMRLGFRRDVAEDGSDRLWVEVWAQPGGGVSAHIHPGLEERFEVLSGEATFLAGRKKVRARAGETVVVPPGLRHGFRNTGKEVVHLMTEVFPPLELEGFLTDVAALARAGKFNRLNLPTSVSGLLQAAVMVRHYRETVVLLQPPLLLQRLLIAPLARLGERRGYRAGAFA